jgi:nitroreductase
MDVDRAILERRSFRSLEPIEVDENLIMDLAGHAQLAPSCANSQPTRFVFVFEPEAIKAMSAVFSKGNEWAQRCSLIIAVFSRKEDDCLIKEREYHLFDDGLAVGFLILRAHELGLVAHPIGGYSPAKTRDVLGIPEEYTVVTLILVGRKTCAITPILTEKQLAWELDRPERLPLDTILHRNHYRG